MNPSSVDDSTYDREIVIMALMVALGVILDRLEALFPLPTPWIKLGLANLMTLVVLFYLGTREAFIVTLLRVILGSILAGTFLGPAFFSQPGRWPGWHRNHVWDLQQLKKTLQLRCYQHLWSLYSYFHHCGLCLFFPYKTNFLFRPVAFFLLTSPDYCNFDRSGTQSFSPKNKASCWVSAGPLKV